MSAKKTTRKTRLSEDCVRRRLLYWARSRAKRKGVRFEITLNDIVVPRYCPVLGLRLRAGSASDASPTLDRIDPRLGYVPGNVLVICRLANTAKSSLDLNGLLRLTAFYQQLRA